jgi:hypothetical protein
MQLMELGTFQKTRKKRKRKERSVSKTVFLFGDGYGERMQRKVLQK